MSFHRKLVPALGVLLIFVSTSASRAQTVTPALGYIYTKQVLSDLTQSCVEVGLGATFVGQGPGFTGNAQSVVRVTESGVETTVVSGFNSIADCVYDAAADTLYVTDNALEASGSVTGDTVYLVAAASTASGLSAVGLELVAAGSIPSAASVALDASGDVYVSNSAGGGLGSVQKISGGIITPFIAAGLDFVGGIAFDGDGDLLVADSLPSFESQVSRYDSTGGFVEVSSGPTFAHGSIDLRFNVDGNVLITGLFGGPVMSLDPLSGTLTTFASGFTFTTGVDLNEFTGRVELLSSTFSFPDPAEEDLSIHRFTPVDRLVAGKGSSKKSCVSELYGLELVPKKAGKPAKDAICVDGASCDADGVVNDACLFPLGFCMNVDDPGLADCASEGLVSFEIKKVKPAADGPLGDLAGVATEIDSALPVNGSTCFFSDGLSVPIKITNSGKRKNGKGLVKTIARSADAKPLKDVDVVKLVCKPAP